MSSSLPSHLIPRTPRSHVSHSPASSAAVYEPYETNRAVSTYDSEPHPRLPRDSVSFRSERQPSFDEQRTMLIREAARQQRAQADLDRRIAEQLANERRGYLPSSASHSRSDSRKPYSPDLIDGVPSELRSEDFLMSNNNANRPARNSRDYFSSHPSLPSRPVSTDSQRSLNSQDRAELARLRQLMQEQGGRRSPSLPGSDRSLNSQERADLTRLRAEEARWLETQSTSTVRQDDVKHWVESQQR
jgi:hypothetical protein